MLILIIINVLIKHNKSQSGEKLRDMPVEHEQCILWISNPYSDHQFCLWSFTFCTFSSLCIALSVQREQGGTGHTAKEALTMALRPLCSTVPLTLKRSDAARGHHQELLPVWHFVPRHMSQQVKSSQTSNYSPRTFHYNFIIHNFICPS